MIKYVSFICTLLIVGVIQAQTKQFIRVRNSDEMLKVFESIPNPFEAFDKISTDDRFDYKSCYYNEKLKIYLIKLLTDMAGYYDYEKEKDLQDYINNKYGKFTKAIRYDILRYLKKYKKEDQIDSVLNNKILYRAYLDSIAQARRKWELKFREEGITKRYPPDAVITLHSIIAYPESYQFIKKLSKEKSKEDEMYYVTDLIQMGDPTAKDFFSKKVKKFVKSNGEIGSIPILFVASNSYEISVQIQLLNVTKAFEFISDDPPIPMNCKTIKNLVSTILFENIKIDPSIKDDQTCDELMKNKKKIIEAAQELMKKYDERNEYWVKNLKYVK